MGLGMQMSMCECTECLQAMHAFVCVLLFSVPLHAPVVCEGIK